MFFLSVYRFLYAGIITTKARIDYESIKQIYVNAYVTDTGIPQMTSTAEIIVDIVNMNDNEPIFSLPVYRFTVAENSPKGTFIGKINAKDGDDGKLFGPKTFQLLLLRSFPLPPFSATFPMFELLKLVHSTISE